MLSDNSQLLFSIHYIFFVPDKMHYIFFVPDKI